jgi:hypothetical protein
MKTFMLVLLVIAAALAGDAMYLGFQKFFQARFPGLSIHVPMTMGHRFVFAGGKIADGAEAAPRPSR